MSLLFIINIRTLKTKSRNNCELPMLNFIILTSNARIHFFKFTSKKIPSEKLTLVGERARFKFFRLLVITGYVYKSVHVS